MSDYTPSLSTLLSAYRRRKPGTSYVMWASQDHVTTTPDAEFDRAIAKVRADAKVEALREAAAVVASEEAYQWRMDRGAGVYGMRVPGAQIVAQRMQIVGKIITDRADNLDAG